MIENIIMNYINKMTTNDLTNLMHKNNLSCDEEDINIIYQYLKLNKEKILKTNIHDTLRELKGIVKENSFKDIYRLYLKYEKEIETYFNNK